MPVRMLKKLDQVRWVFFSSSLREGAGAVGCEGFAMILRGVVLNERVGEDRLRG